MLCDICKNGLEGLWDPNRTARVGLVDELFDEIVANHFVKPHTDEKGYRKEKWDVERYFYGHHQNPKSWLDSQEEGCVQCNRFPSPNNLGFVAKTNYISVFRVSSQEGILKMEIYTATFSTSFELVPVDHESYSQGLNFDMGWSNNSPETWSLIETWNSGCRSSHTRCSELGTSDKDMMPTRVLEIGQCTDGGIGFRLVDGHSCHLGSRYCTLSYCWGAKPAEGVYRLTRSSVTALRLLQSINVLPKSLRDAMSIAQRLGMKYIWIDRLCIFQDSPEDWSREASTMQKVYKNADLSIAALSASSDDGGCFFDRDPSKAGITKLYVQLLPDQPPKPFRSKFEKAWGWQYAFRDEPLLKRAWVLQERALAPRVLYFGRTQVFWECCQMRCCETHPVNIDIDDDTSVDSQRNMTNSPYRSKHILSMVDRGWTTDLYGSIFEDWYGLLDAYVKCKLTMEGDKLVALMGLAHDMRERLESVRPDKPHEYIAGLWRERFLECLTWTMNSPGRRTTKYRAPSWSWASIEGPVIAPFYVSDERTMPLASVHFADMGDEKFTATRKLDENQVTFIGSYGEIQMIEYKRPEPLPSVTLISGIQNAKGESALNVQSQNLVVPPKFEFDTVEDEKYGSINLLLLIAMQPGSEHWYVSGLGLVCLEDGTYRRVGKASFIFNDGVATRTFISKLPDREIVMV